MFVGHGAGQRFTGRFDTATGRVASTYDAAIPEGWVAARGGHGTVSAELGGDAANHVGFAAILEEGGTLRTTWRSGTPHQPPSFEVADELRPTVVDAQQQATGHTVSTP